MEHALPEIHRAYTDPSTLVFRSRVMHGNTCSPYGRRSSRVFLHFFSRDPDLENVSPIPGGEGRVESGAESRGEFGRKPVSRRDNAF